MALLGSGRLPFSFFPPLASDQVIAKLTMPLGTNPRMTEAGIEQLEDSANLLATELKSQYPNANPVMHIASSIEAPLARTVEAREATWEKWFCNSRPVKPRT